VDRQALQIGKVSERLPKTAFPAQTPKTQKPRIAGLSCKSWRETKDSNPGNAINVRRFSRPLCKLKQAVALRAVGVPLLTATDYAIGRILQGARFLFWNCFLPSPASCRMNTNHQKAKSYERHRDRFRPRQCKNVFERCWYSKPD